MCAAATFCPCKNPVIRLPRAARIRGGLIVALDASGCAKGELYIDDGESLKPSATLEVKFAASAGTLNVTVTGDYKDSNALANVTVLGVGGNVEQSPSEWQRDQ